MINKFVAATLLASAFVAAPAVAQTKMDSNAPAVGQMDTKSHANMWRSSKVIGLDVYNDNNEKLGDIRELLINKSGTVAGVVIGVGGFLGMGEHDIMVEMNKLKFVDESVRSANNTKGADTTTTGAKNTAPSTNANNTTNTVRDRMYPDHAVLSGATKDSLKAMQQFKY